MATLELRFLGGLAIQQDGMPLTALKSQKGQALLCYLAVTGKAHSRPALAGLLWPEMPEANALTNLRKVLNRLNPHLAPYLVISRQSVAFNPDAACWLDVAEFEAGLVAKSDTGRLQKAASLYQGDFLDGFYLPDAPPFDEWVLAQRARLREAALAALHHLVTHFAGRGAHEMSITHARQLLNIEPWQEEVHRELMRLLALSGQRSAALMQYQMCRRILAEELGVSLAQATMNLYEQIRDNKLTGWSEPVTSTNPVQALSSPKDESEGHSVTLSSPRPVVPSQLHNLPAQSTRLVGRTTELERLGQLLADPHGRLITIVGIGGIGKTRVALALAEQQVTKPRNNLTFTGGVYFVPLASLSEANHILPTLAQAIGFQIQADDRRASEQQVLDFLRHKRTLLLFDNFEHLLDGTSLITNILQAAPQVKVLVTARECLRLYEEQVFPLEGLAFSEGMATEEDAAVQLFLQRAQRVRPDFVLQEADMRHLTTICRQVEGMPLALELAAAWVDALPLADIAGELGQSLDLLKTEWRDVPGRHRSIRAVFEISWQRLSDEEQQISSRLSVFRGSFTQHAAWQVVAPQMSQLTFRRSLAVLVGKSFLRYDPTPDRYDLHELLRQFASEKLAQSPDVESAARDRHSAHYCVFLHEHTEHWHSARQLETLAAVTREADNVERAWRWALTQGEWQRLVRAIDSWGWFLNWQGRYTDGKSFCQAIVQKVERQSGERAFTPHCLRLWAKALAWLGWFTADLNISVGVLEQSLALLERPELVGQDTRREKAFVLLLESRRLLDPDLERQFIEQSLALYQELGNQWGTAAGLGALGHLDWRAGNYETGLDRVQAALAIHQEQADRQEQAESIARLGLIHKSLGHLEEAERLEREALSLSRQISDRSALVVRHANLAYTLLWRGKFAEAQQIAEESLAICRDLGGSADEAWPQYCLSEALMHSGQYRRSRQQAARALPLAREFDDWLSEGGLYGVLGQLALAESSYAGAQAAFAKSAEIFREVQYSLIDLSPAGLGYTACGLRQPQEARRHLVEALASVLAAKSYIRVVFALPGVALLLAETGAMIRAVEIWALARCHPFVANSKWFDDVAGRELDDLAATLSTEMAEAAQERGRMLDLWHTAAEVLEELAGELLDKDGR